MVRKNINLERIMKNTEEIFFVGVGILSITALISIFTEPKIVIKGVVLDTMTVKGDLNGEELSTFSVLFKDEKSDTYNIRATGTKKYNDIDDIYRKNFHPGSSIYAYGKVRGASIYKKHDVKRLDGHAWSEPVKDWKIRYNHLRQKRMQH